MYVSGTTVLQGGGFEARPVPYAHTVTYRPVERRNTSPFLNMSVSTETVRKKPGPKPRVSVQGENSPAVKKERKKREPNPNARRHVPYYEQERIVQAREYMASTKTCLFCNEEFGARPGERIDGYRRRETCNRVCAAKRARLRREGKLDD